MAEARTRKRKGDAEFRAVTLPPQSIEAEQAVLGGLMLAPDTLDTVIEILSVRDFYRRDHQLIFQAICALSEASKPFDAVTLGEWFESQGHGELVAGGAYLVELASTTPSAANIQAYAEIVRDKSALRDLVEVGTEITNNAYNPQGREAPEVIAEAEQRVFALAESGTLNRRGYVTARQGLSKAFDTLQVRYGQAGSLIGLPTGYHEFDKMLAGLQKTDLIILAARPAMGKTTLALNIAEYASLKSNVAVAVFSMEMSAEQLYMRILASKARVDSQKLRTADLEDEDWGKISGAVRALAPLKILVDDEGSLTPEKLRSKARRMKREHDIQLIVVDYLQLMTVAGSEENRANIVGEISRSLKALAKELKVPVIALSQLNRSLETRSDKRPVMADLRESGSIEQDADTIVFIYRDDYYNKENSPDKGLAEIIVAKQRNGPTGSFKLRFFSEYTQFANLSQRGDDEIPFDV